MRPVFCGNFEYDARPSEIEHMFSKFGKVDRVDMKTGVCIERKCSCWLLDSCVFHHDANSFSCVRAPAACYVQEPAVDNLHFRSDHDYVIPPVMSPEMATSVHHSSHKKGATGAN
eukprot:TRINITY_DN12923_c0_g1_i6.p1 TRINITY_DN12923_c0_g1~~TRINITY_DN12923_c0_g1_i6.p1  ORF type:complete len:115 (-),score=14.44 TRINITY_DN12923_c0_g1_i6:297-641(-)